MAKRPSNIPRDFGKQLAQLRKDAGYTQTELAAVLPKLAQLLKVSTDELLGIKPLHKTRQPDSRLLRRMQQIDKLSAPRRKQIVQVIDTFIEAEQFRQQHS